MADISSIDGYLNPWRSSTNRPSTKDFADELAKEDSKVQSDKRAQIRQDYEARSNAQARSEATTEQAPSAVHVVAATSLPGDSRMSAAIAAGLAAAQEQLSVAVQPIGVTEALLGSRVFGMHLLAGVYLSELTPTEAEASDVTLDAVKAMQSVASSLEERTVSLDSLLSQKEARLEGSSSVESIVMQSTLASNEISGTDASIQMAVAAISTDAPLAPWLERSLRFTRQSDGSTVAWLRDYRADNDEMAKLIESLVHEAKANGTMLSKIMLNGREVWTSRNNT